MSDSPAQPSGDHQFSSLVPRTRSKLHNIGLAESSVAEVADHSPPAVALLSTAPDFAALVAFLLRFHGFAVQVAEPAALHSQTAPATTAELIALDLAGGSVGEQQIAPPTPPGARCPVVVLTRPDTAGLAQQLAAPPGACLMVPLQPRVLVALAWQLVWQARDSARMLHLTPGG